jgi:hypothetical protein
MILRNSSAFNDAPPISPPSTSGCEKSSPALPAFTEPPYKMVVLFEILLPNNELPIYKNVKHRGIYRFDKSKIYQVKYVVGDIEGNESVLTFHIKGNNDGVSFIPKIPFITKK